MIFWALEFLQHVPEMTIICRYWPTFANPIFSPELVLCIKKLGTCFSNTFWCSEGFWYWQDEVLSLKMDFKDVIGLFLQQIPHEMRKLSHFCKAYFFRIKNDNIKIFWQKASLNTFWCSEGVQKWCHCRVWPPGLYKNLLKLVNVFCTTSQTWKWTSHIPMITYIT